ncbi:UNVERIFIED_CONTAM: hypothetical protein K2H54_063189 [Gekko kuhli]
MLMEVSNRMGDRGIDGHAAAHSNESIKPPAYRTLTAVLNKPSEDVPERVPTSENKPLLGVSRKDAEPEKEASHASRPDWVQAAEVDMG